MTLKSSIQSTIGITLFILGLLSIFLPIASLSRVAYPIVWWGLLLLLDLLNFSLRGTSPIRSYPRHFFAILIPLSVLFYIYFEFVSLIYPQWYYVVNLEGFIWRGILAFTSFSTVIPAMIGVVWFVSGIIILPRISANFLKVLKKYRFSFCFVGLVLYVTPFLVRDIPTSLWNFPSAQIVLLIPALIAIPFLKFEDYKPEEKKGERKRWFRFLVLITVASITTGLFWEFFNFRAEGKWVYVLMPDIYHLFGLPIYTYFNYIPFAVSNIAVYLAAREFLKPKLLTSMVLYALAIMAITLFIYPSYLLGVWRIS